MKCKEKHQTSAIPEYASFASVCIIDNALHSKVTGDNMDSNDICLDLIFVMLDLMRLRHWKFTANINGLSGASKRDVSLLSARYGKKVGRRSNR